MPSIFKIAPLALAAALLTSGAAVQAQAQAQEQLVRIGVSGPLSGANAFAGKDNENGVRLAVEELNAQKLKAGGKRQRQRRNLEFRWHSLSPLCSNGRHHRMIQRRVDRLRRAAGAKSVPAAGPWCT